MVLRSMVWRLKISIHALREESDLDTVASFDLAAPFQSTLSVRRATGQVVHTCVCITFQSTLSVRRATETLPAQFVPNTFQSTLSVRRATDLALPIAHDAGFQSTLSVRRATERHTGTLPDRQFSIHALREESDPMMTRNTRVAAIFNPRSP